MIGFWRTWQPEGLELITVRKNMLVSIVFLLFSQHSFADDCGQNQTTAKICEEKASFKKVSEAYTYAMKVANENNSAKWLQQTQNAWLKYKDTTCTYIQTLPSNENYDNDWLGCALSFNNARVATLNRYIKLMQSH